MEKQPHKFLDPSLIRHSNDIPNVDSQFIVEVENVEKIYNQGKENEVKALRGISFKIEQGDFVSIMGPSGSGKTTLLHILGALDTPTSGTVRIRNKVLSTSSEADLTIFRRKEIGFVFQYYNLIPTLSALENVDLPMTLANVPKKNRGERAVAMLKLVGLQDRMNNKPNQLSGGQIQRVAIARALANQPAIILADEPTGNLDSKIGTEIMDLFTRLNREHGQTFLVVTHDPRVAKYTTKTFHIKDGLLDHIEINQK